jgi:hypothetical protein
MGCAAPHPFHWDDLRKCPAEEVAQIEGVGISSDGSAYEVSFLNALYRVDIKTETISEISPNPNRRLSEEFQILLIRYLVSPYRGGLENVAVTEKDFQGGVIFFQGPHALHVNPIGNLYGRNLRGFTERGYSLGAEIVSYGDVAMKFYPFPRIPVSYILWKEDDEFPASVSLLFDRSIAKWFEFDMIFTLVMVLTERIVEGQSKGSEIQKSS